MRRVMKIRKKRRQLDHVKYRIGLIALCFFSIMLPALSNAAPPTKLKIRFIDSNTGYAVYPEEVSITDNAKKQHVYKKTFSKKEEAKKEFDKGVLPSSVSFEPTSYEYTITHPGYKPMRAHFDFSTEQLQSIEFHLTPLDKPAELDASSLSSLKDEDHSVKVGFIVDDDTGLPLSGVQVSTADGQNTAWTNDRGFFKLHIPLQKSSDQVHTTNILFEKPGYQAEERDFEELKPSEVSITRVRLISGQGKHIIDQRKNSGKNSSESPSASDLMSDVLKSIYEQNQPTPNAYFTGSPIINADLFLSQIVMGTFTPAIPETIRVGTNCNRTRNGCTGAAVHMLDEYVKMVLPAEWAQCWGDLTGGMNALWAGAIAARTYAAYMVFHPIYPDLYDICDNESCQAIKTPEDNTNQAVDATVGLVLVDSMGQIFLSEFSSENNNSGYRDNLHYCDDSKCQWGGTTWDSCGDGYVGRKNSTEWPCIADPVSMGFIINGHGKGMSQYGSARWATGLLISPSAVCSANNPPHNYGVKTWDQILNQYYPNAQIVTGTNFNIGDRVRVIQSVNVRTNPCRYKNDPLCAPKCMAYKNAVGTVIGGPHLGTEEDSYSNPPINDKFTFWNIAWDNGTVKCDDGTTGWSVENNLVRAYDAYNHTPQLLIGYVDPASGSSNTDFYYYVYYNDPDGNAPLTANVYIDNTPHAMTLYADGSYVFGPIRLSAGSHFYNFNFTDGNGGSVWLPYAGTSPGPVVTTPPASYTLGVSKSGAGAGVVVSNIGGINCGSDCQETYSAGTIVTLTATPDANSSFSGWSGACSGVSVSCTLTMDATKSATAAFGPAAASTGWNITYGDGGFETAKIIQQTPDGGYILAGAKRDSYAYGYNDIWILKLDANKNIQWQRNYGGTLDEDVYAIQQISGGYLVVGRTNNSSGMPLTWILKLDTYGNVLWQKYYDFNISCCPSTKNENFSVFQASDGGYVLGGYLDENDPSYLTGKTSSIMKIDGNGAVVWLHEIGKFNDTWYSSIKPTQDGGIIAVGSTYAVSGGSNADIKITKFNSSIYTRGYLSVDWQATYGGSGDDFGNLIEPTNDGGYIVAGITTSFGAAGSGRNVWVLKLDGSGNIRWQKTYGGTGDDAITAIRRTSDGAYIAAGSTTSFGRGGSDAWVFKISDYDGSVLWQKTYGGSNNDSANSIQQTSDGGYLIAGGTASFGSGGNDAWVFKIDRDGNTDGNCSIEGTSNIQVYTSNAAKFTPDYLFTGGSSGDYGYAKVSSGAVSATSITPKETCTRPNIVVTPVILSFGSINVGGAVSQSIAVMNAGSAALTINSITISGANASEFSQTNNCSTVAAGSSCTLTVTFRPASFGQKAATLAIYSNDPDTPLQNVSLSGKGGYTLTIVKPGTGAGTVTSSPAGINCGTDCSEIYNQGTQITLTAKPDAGSVFAGWSGTSCSGTRDCTLTVNADTTVMATFNLIPPVADFEASFTSGVFPLTVAFTDLSIGKPTSWAWDFGDGATSNAKDPTHTYESMGDYTVALTVTNALGSGYAKTERKSNFITVTNYITYTITASAAGSNGTISPSGPVVAIYGTNRTFSIAPAPGYHISDVLIDGVSIGPVNAYTFTNISADHAIEARFEATSYTITAAAGAGGGISPSGTQPFSYGASQAYTISPNTASGYYIADVRVDGKSVGAVTQYSFNNIAASHTIEVIFSNAATHTITASAGTGGSISPSGSVTVNTGNDQTFTITPDAGYHITDVLIDGTISIGTAVSYQFKNVTIDHMIEARFSNTYTLTVIKSGINAGTVTSNIAGIDCGPDCTETYISGTAVSLTSLANAGSPFTGWYGACTGITTTCNVTMDSDKTIIATFGVSSWAKTYGGGNDDEAEAIQQTSDGGYIMAGKTKSFGSGGFDAWVVKLDKDGKVEWQKAYGGDKDDEVNSILQNSDGDYIIAGKTYSYGVGSNPKGWILKLDKTGNVKWQQTYGGACGGDINAFQRLSNGGYIVAGTHCQDTGVVGNSFWLFKIDESGNILSWQKKYYGDDFIQYPPPASSRQDYWTTVFPTSIQQTADGGYIVGGKTTTVILWNSGKNDGTLQESFVMKLNSDGSIRWAKTYKESAGVWSVRQNGDGSYIVAFKDKVLKLYPDGGTNESKINWQRTFAGNEGLSISSIQQTLDSEYVLFGSILSSGHWAPWTLKLDTAGSIKWQKKYTSDGKVNFMQQTYDSGYIAASLKQANTADAGTADAWVLKLDGNGSVPGGCAVDKNSAAWISGSSVSVTEDDFALWKGSAIVSDTSVVPQAASASTFDTTADSHDYCRPQITASPSTLDIGSVDIGSSATKSILVKNVGTLPLVIDSIDFGGMNLSEFLQTNNCSMLAADSSCTISVTFLSITVGLKSATLGISSNDPDTPILNVPITAVGGRKLTVTKKGDAPGTVTSIPAGINCGAVCAAGYLRGTQVVLSAVPDTSKIIFYGWSGGGCSDTGSCRVTLNADTTVTAEFNYLPTADFSASPTTVEIIPFVPTTFTDKSLHTTSWHWDFGDGAVSNEQNPVHTYKGVGKYTVTLTASNPYGVDTKIMTDYIIVQPCPNLPVRIAGATPAYYDTLQEAYDAAGDHDTIQTLAINLTGNLDVDRDVSVTLAGGYNCRYTAPFDKTALQGMITTSTGTVTIGDFELMAGPAAADFSITAAADRGGSISPQGTLIAYRGQNETFTITPYPGYTIVDILVDGVSIGPVAAYTLTNIASNHTIEAIFTHILSVAKAGTASGTVTSSPAGINCGNDCTEKYSAGAVVTLTATPDTDSVFAGWSGGGCGGTGNCTITMAANTVVTATFNLAPPLADFSGAPVAGVETVTVGFSDLSIRNPVSWLWDFGDGAVSTEKNPTHTFNYTGAYTVTLTASNAGGSGTKVKTNYITVQPCPNLPVRIAGATPAYYDTLQEAYNAAPDGAVIQSRDLGFIENLVANRNISVTLEGGYNCGYAAATGVTKLKGMITTSAGTLTIGNFELVTEFTDNTYFITASAGSGGSISPAGTITAPPGVSRTFTITPSSNSFIFDVYVDGVSVGPVSTYTLGSITANHTIEAVFATNYTITATAGSNGSISPSGAVTVVSGFSKTFVMTPTTGYHVADVLVDGVSVGAVSSYTFSDVMSNHTITASFAINTYTITASAGAGGSISPLGAVTVNYGSSQTFTMTPSPGYLVLNVLVDGVSVGAVNTYTFTNVTANHSIQAVFSSTLSITKSGTGSGAVTSSPAGINCGATCAAEYMQGTVLTLTATPVAGSIFDGWSGGGCSGTGACTVTMNADTSVTATFTMSHARITGATPVYYPTIQAAYNAAANGAVIQSRDMNIAENLSVNRDVSVTLEGGCNYDYTSCSGITTLTGMITTSAGTLTIKSFTLQK